MAEPNPTTRITAGQSRADALTQLGNQEFDVLVIGGGIFGAVTVWQARQRGLTAALVEATDFGHGSSANSYKIIHGGIRYMQHLDIPRVLSSSRERSAFMRMAPHLCDPLPIAIPTYGWGKLGKPFLGAGCYLYDLVTFFRNKGINDETRKIPFTRFIGKKAILQEFPDLEQKGLTGACIIHDGRFYNPTRLVWAFCNSAQHDGAVVCNYLKAESLVIEDGTVKGVNALDTRSGQTITISSKVVINSAGPWAEDWLKATTNDKFEPKGVYSRDACFVVDKKSNSKYTLAVQGESADPDALLAREKRHLFLSPWRDSTLIGVWHKVTDVKPEQVSVTRQELEIFIEEINGAYPALHLTIDDIRMWNAGLVPFGDEQTSDKDLSYGKRSNLIDHEATDGLKNLVTLIGLRYTMARGEGEKILNLVQRKLSQPVSTTKTDHLRLHSASFHSMEQFTKQMLTKAAGRLSETACVCLVRNHGTQAVTILDMIETQPELAEVYPGTTVTAAEIHYVCEHEMVESLSDIVLRRTDVATAGNPGDGTLQAIAAEVAKLQNWSAERLQEELQQVRSYFPG